MTLTEKTFYVYMLHEVPLVAPYPCKVGMTDDPLRRLDELQSGNPRFLRPWDTLRRPEEPFGFELPTREHAARFEERVHAHLAGMGMQLWRDLKYSTLSAPPREWFEGMHPEKLWPLMAKMYGEYLTEFALWVWANNRAS